MAEASNIYVGVAGYFGKPEQIGKVGIFQRAAKGGDWRHVLGNVEAFTVFVHPGNPETVFAGRSSAAPVWVYWSRCSLIFIPAADAASRMHRVCSTVKCPSSQ